MKWREEKNATLVSGLSEIKPVTSRDSRTLTHTHLKVKELFALFRSHEEEFVLFDFLPQVLCDLQPLSLVNIPRHKGTFVCVCVCVPWLSSPAESPAGNRTGGVAIARQSCHVCNESVSQAFGMMPIRN